MADGHLGGQDTRIVSFLDHLLAVDKMKYVNLGKSGLKVSQIILGCMSYGVKRPADKWTWVLEEEEAMKHLKVSFPLLVHGLKLTR